MLQAPIHSDISYLGCYLNILSFSFFFLNQAIVIEGPWILESYTVVLERRLSSNNPAEKNNTGKLNKRAFFIVFFLILLKN